MGLEPPTDNPLVLLAFEGCMRMTGKPAEKKEALPVEVIKELVDKFCENQFNLLDLRFVIICLLGFAGFFRIDELIALKLKQLQFRPQFLLVILEKSKTDQHRHGHEVYISATKSQYCPVRYVQTFLDNAKLSIMDTPEAFLLPRLFKTKKGHNASKTLGISYTTVHDNFKEKITRSKPEHAKYGIHSLRSGGASAAAQNGVSDRLIAKQGRWSSETARNGYIKDSVSTRLSASASLGL